jgi:hypothetical protein
LTLDNFGGAVPPPDSVLYPSFGLSPQNSAFFYRGANLDLKFSRRQAGDNLQQQINVTDNVSRIVGAHQMKFGLDYRRLSPEAGPYPIRCNMSSFFVERSGQHGA